MHLVVGQSQLPGQMDTNPLQQVLALEPENVDAMTNLAYVYREMGNNKKALEWLTKAEKLQKE